MEETRSTSAETSASGKRSKLIAVLSHLIPAILFFTSGYLTIANRASGPPRVELSAFAYEGFLLLHVGLGLLAVLRFIATFTKSLKRAREQKGMAGVFSLLMLLSLAVTLLTGVAFLGFGFGWLPFNMRPALRLTHDISTIAVIVFGLLAILARAKRKEATPEERLPVRRAVGAVFIFGVPFVAMLAYTVYAPNTDRLIVNPPVPPKTHVEEGGGENGHFFPASVQTVNDQFFPPEYYTDSKACGEKGCHPDIYAQWNSSAHHRSSFNNQWYRKSIEYMQEAVGTKPSKWCGGCHDMAILQTEDPQNPGKPRFDRPIKTQILPVEENPTSHAGIGCAACHSIVHVKSTMGVSDFTADYPPMHKYLDTKNPMMKSVHKFLTTLAPEPHKKTFLRPFHRDQTAKFCSSCHKVHLDKAVNDYRWLRGQNEYDAWQGSGVSGFGAASFYYPMDEKTGQPAFKKCADCHMPKVPSADAGNKGGFVKDHAFPGGNTALPYVYHDKEQLKKTTDFLKDKALSIDVFAIRRQKTGAKAQTTAVKTQGGTTESPTAASMSFDPNAVNITAGQGFAAEEEISSPLNRGGKGTAFKRGESPLVEVVVRTLKLGHAFPGGTTDAFDIWVELEAKDEKGRTFFHSGRLQWEDGPVDAAAEKYRALVIDGNANRIDRRNVWALRSTVYAKAIPPGAADVVHYRLKIPKDVGGKVTLTAKLNYRKFDFFNNFWAFAGRTGAEPKPELASAAYRAGKSANPFPSEKDIPLGIALGKKAGEPFAHAGDLRAPMMDANLQTVSGEMKEVPVLPITVLAESTVAVPVVAENAAPDTPVQPLDEKKDRIRWNDYGIGLLLQGDLKNATYAFTQVTNVSPKWAEGYVNIGRVRQVERDTPAAQAALEKAFQLYAAAPTPMTRYQKARAQNFYAQSLFDGGRIDDALNIMAQVREVFPDDRNVRNLTGAWLFRLGRYEEAIAHFKHSLSIEPEDVAAHYNLMKCYRAKGDMQTASTHEHYYKRFKADETNTRLSGEYRRKNPWDNNLAQPIHEIGDTLVLPKPKWLLEWEKRKATLAMKSGIGRRMAGKWGTSAYQPRAIAIRNRSVQND
jgi:Flp pilus assembly protein TadD